MEWFADSAAKGLFAEADRAEREDIRGISTIFAARIALREGLIDRSDDFATLADVEEFLRASASNVYFLALPRTTENGTARASSFSWLSDENARVAGQPGYVLVAATNEQDAHASYAQYQVTAAENLCRLAYTGLPDLPDHTVHEAKLLGFMSLAPPSIWD
jgi:hypothetical protein